MPRAAGADHRVRTGHVRRSDHRPDIAGTEQIVVHREHIEIRMVQHVEKLSAKLKTESLVESPHLRERKIPVLECRPSEDIAPGVAERAEGGSREYGAILHIAAVVRQHVHRTLTTRFLCSGNTLRISAGHVTAGVSRKIVGDVRNRCSGGPMNIVRTTRNVPAIFENSCGAVVILEVIQRVRLAALQRDDAGYQPSFQHLEF